MAVGPGILVLPAPPAETKLPMALHREIYWVGRQWAVTGHGLQACDQKHKGQFDIDASRLWEDGVLESVRALKWLNSEDFDKALAVARKHFPEPPRKTLPPEESVPPEERVMGLIETVLQETSPKGTPVVEPKPAAQKFNMRIDSWPAKFVTQWRVRIRR
jgi:hypothetical protein